MGEILLYVFLVLKYFFHLLPVIKSDEAEKLVAHLDIRNQRTFEVADLAKLIRQVCSVYFNMYYDIFNHYLN